MLISLKNANHIQRAQQPHQQCLIQTSVDLKTYKMSHRIVQDQSLDLGADQQDLTLFVQNLLQQMQNRFQTVSNTIISRIDEMGSRIDELEKNINDLMVRPSQSHIR